MNATLEAALERSRAKKAIPEPRVRRLIREAAGLSQDDLARALGVTRPTVTRWEGGQTPRGVTLVAYVQLLDRLIREAAS